MIEENDIFGELYGIIIKGKIQVSNTKHRLWIHNTITQRKKLHSYAEKKNL